MRIVRRRAARAVRSLLTVRWLVLRSDQRQPILAYPIGQTGSKQIDRPRSGHERPRSDRERDEAG